jgi:hypothetical protein
MPRGTPIALQAEEEDAWSRMDACMLMNCAMMAPGPVHPPQPWGMAWGALLPPSLTFISKALCSPRSAGGSKRGRHADWSGQGVQARQGVPRASEQLHQDREEPRGEGPAARVQGEKGEEARLEVSVDFQDQCSNAGAPGEAKSIISSCTTACPCMDNAPGSVQQALCTWQPPLAHACMHPLRGALRRWATRGSCSGSLSRTCYSTARSSLSWP